MKILKDHSDSELKTYYWYIGVVATNGETLGILIDANSGEIIAKNVYIFKPFFVNHLHSYYIARYLYSSKN